MQLISTLNITMSWIIIVVLILVCFMSVAGGVAFWYLSKKAATTATTANTSYTGKITNEEGEMEMEMENESTTEITNISGGSQKISGLQIKGQEDVEIIQQYPEEEEEENVVPAEEEEGDVIGSTIEPCPTDKERVNGDCYPKCPQILGIRRNENAKCECSVTQTAQNIDLICPPGYTIWDRDGECHPTCPTGTERSDNDLCIPKSVKRVCQVGTPIMANKCPDNHDRIRNLCYPKCPEGHTHDTNACMCISGKRSRKPGPIKEKVCPENRELIAGKCYSSCPEALQRVPNSSLCQVTLTDCP